MPPQPRVLTETATRVQPPPARRGWDRREFLASAAAAALTSCAGARASCEAPLFRLSLAEWSLHRTLRDGGDVAARNLEFPAIARELGFEAVEYVNQFFPERAGDTRYLRDLRRACEDAGVRSLLIMVDGEGHLGDPDAARRARAVANHHPWVEAARALGCHSIRVNAQSSGTPEDQAALAADGLRRLTEFAEGLGIAVLVENHGGLSSNGAWLAGVIRRVAHPSCGTLPDFGNFRVAKDEEYDRYRGVAELMPFAKAVSAKSHDFDAAGDEVHTDYLRMLRIVLNAGYRGHVGVEYEGQGLAERDGILATQRLLRRVRDALRTEFTA